jgi:hypothetical protein
MRCEAVAQEDLFRLVAQMAALPGKEKDLMGHGGGGRGDGCKRSDALPQQMKFCSGGGFDQPKSSFASFFPAKSSPPAPNHYSSPPRDLSQQAAGGSLKWRNSC